MAGMERRRRCTASEDETADGLVPSDELLATYPRLGDAVRTCATRFVDSAQEAELHGASLGRKLHEAYLYYLDNIVDGAKSHYPRLRQSSFFSLMLDTSPVLRPLYEASSEREQLFVEWRHHLNHAPRVGAVLMDGALEKCLMVRSFKGELWTHPSGKVEADESDVDAAVREVLEETGVDVADIIDEEQFIKLTLKDKDAIVPVTLFLVAGVPSTVSGKPQTEKEVSQTAWIRTDKLPGWKLGGAGRSKLRFGHNVECFVPKLRRWVERRKALAAAPVPVMPSCPLSPAAGVAAGAAESGCGERGGASWLRLDMVMCEFDRGWEAAFDRDWEAACDAQRGR